MKCNKKCPHYCKGMCFKDNEHVKILREGQDCVYDKEKKE